MSDKQIVVVAKAKAGDGKLAETEKQLKNLIEPTRAEDGCITYQLHRGEDSKDLFLFYEVWESRQHWEAHLETPHFKAFAEKVEELLAWPPEISVWKKES